MTSKWSCSDLGLNRAPSAAVVQAERQKALRAQLEADRLAAQARTRRATQTEQTTQAAQRSGRPPVPVPTPAHPSRLVNCDGAGCWDTNGQRHNNAAGGNFHRSDGKFCQRIGGGQVICN